MNKTEHANRVTVLMAPYLSDLQSNCLSHLTKIYNKWLDSHGLPNESADEVIRRSDLTEDQEVWLTRFIDAWNGLEDVGRFVHHIEKGVDPDFLWALTNFQDNEALKNYGGRADAAKTFRNIDKTFLDLEEISRR